MATARFQVLSLPRPTTDLPTPGTSAVKSSTGRSKKSVPVPSPQPRRFTWRFLAGNNRSLATAAQIFPDAGSCIAAMHELKRGLANAACEYSRDEAGLWRWTVRVEGTMAASSNGYRRHLRAKITCDTFFALAADPAAIANVHVVYR